MHVITHDEQAFNRFHGATFMALGAQKSLEISLHIIPRVSIFKLVLWCRRLIREVKADDLVVVQFLRNAVIFNLCCFRQLPHPHQIVLIEGMGRLKSSWFAMKDSCLGWLLRRSFASDIRIVVLNKQDEFFFRRSGFSRTINMGPLGCPADVRANCLRVRKISSRTPKKILYVGRIMRTKGVFKFLDVAKKIREKGIPLDAEIIGRMELGFLDKLLFKMLSSQAKVRVLGFKKVGVERYLKDSILLFPSQYAEGAPRVIQEAYIAGCPFVMTNFAGAELFKLNRSLICSPEDFVGHAVYFVEKILGEKAVLNDPCCSGELNLEYEAWCSEFLEYCLS